MKRGIVDDTSLAGISELNLYNPALMRKTSDIDIGLLVDAELKQMQRSTKSKGKVSDRDTFGSAPGLSCVHMRNYCSYIDEVAIKVQHCAESDVH